MIRSSVLLQTAGKYPLCRICSSEQSFPEIQEYSSIGGYHDDILNTEKILSLKPDAVIVGQTQFVQNAQRLNLLEKAGIAVIVLDYHAMTLENHVKSTQLLGKLLNRETVAVSGESLP